MIKLAQACPLMQPLSPPDGSDVLVVPENTGGHCYLDTTSGLAGLVSWNAPARSGPLTSSVVEPQASVPTGPPPQLEASTRLGALNSDSNWVALYRDASHKVMLLNKRTGAIRIQECAVDLTSDSRWMHLLREPDHRADPPAGCGGGELASINPCAGHEQRCRSVHCVAWRARVQRAQRAHVGSCTSERRDGDTLRAGPRTSTRRDRVCRSTRPTHTTRCKRTRCDYLSPGNAEGADTLLGRRTRREHRNFADMLPTLGVASPGSIRLTLDFLFCL